MHGFVFHLLAVLCLLPVSMWLLFEYLLSVSFAAQQTTCMVCVLHCIGMCTDSMVTTFSTYAGVLRQTFRYSIVTVQFHVYMAMSATSSLLARQQIVVNEIINSTRTNTVLLEYFAGEKPSRMSRISKKLTLCNLTIAFWQGSLVIIQYFIVAN